MPIPWVTLIYHQVQIFHTMPLWLKLIILLKLECHKDSWHSAWAWKKTTSGFFFFLVGYISTFYVFFPIRTIYFNSRKCYLQHANTKVKTEMCFEDIISELPGEILFPLAVIIALKICDNRSRVFNSVFLNSHLYQIKSICYFLNSCTVVFLPEVKVLFLTVLSSGLSCDVHGSTQFL